VKRVKKNKDIVLEYLQRDYNSEHDHKYSTQELSEKIGISRSNISTLLNELVAEKKVKKSPGRPVLYSLVSSREKVKDSFSTLIGSNGSLANNIKLAKAAAMYPETGLPMIIIGQRCSGLSAFAEATIDYVQSSINPSRKVYSFNCKYFNENPEIITHRLFEDDGDGISLMQKAKNGILVINHANLLPKTANHWFIHELEHSGFARRNTMLICLFNANDSNVQNSFCQHFAIQIHNPSLQQRPLSERNEFIRQFFLNEAKIIGRKIEISGEIYRSLLLYPCEGNIKQLKNDIKVACANAYVRQFDAKSDVLYVYMQDFSANIRKGLLRYRANKNEVDRFVNGENNFVFSKDGVPAQKSDSQDESSTYSIYQYIDDKAHSLKRNDMNEEEIHAIISNNIVGDIQNYNEKRLNEMDHSTIEKLVDKHIVQLVEDFLNTATERLRRVYSSSTLFGLCLHISALAKHSERKQVLSDQKISEIITNNKKEYELSAAFSDRLEKQLKIKIPPFETALITVYLLQDEVKDEDIFHPVILVCMHGQSTALSIANTVNYLMGETDVYSYDLNLEKDMNTAYQELEKTMVSIDRGYGILLIYDMGSIKTMAEAIAAEKEINLKCIEMPATLIVLDFARKLKNAKKIDDVYNDLIYDFKKSFYLLEESYERYNRKNAIITLCMSGQGGAVIIKNYLEKNLDLEGCDIIPLAISDHKQLLKKINELKKEKNIICVVSNYDPKLVGIRYIPLNTVLNTDQQKLEFLLKIDDENNHTEEINYEIIYANLKENLPNFDLNAIQRMMPKVIRSINRKYPLSTDQVVGLIMHITCAAARIKNNTGSVVNDHKNKIIMNNKRLYNDLHDALAGIEKAYGIKFNEDEMAYIISIIKQI
jgi:transcriptional regulatory protein LevR/transcriptional regulator with AAA-type ATPase domain